MIPVQVHIIAQEQVLKIFFHEMPKDSLIIN
jgi:hypothetical protein